MTSYETGEAARLFVIADAQGKILAAVRPPEAASVGVGAPTAVGIRPADGQALHEILLPDEPERADILQSLGSYYVNLAGGQPRLSRGSR